MLTRTHSRQSSSKVRFILSVFINVENEFHFVCICNAYTTLRNTMYDTINEVTFYMTNKVKFVYLMKNWKQWSQYIETVWDYRISILYKQT